MTAAFERQSPRDVGRIVSAVCQRFGLGERTMASADRRTGVAHPRMLAMYLCRERLGISYSDIGKAFGRDHSTAMWGVRKIALLRQAGNPLLEEHIRAITNTLDAPAQVAPPIPIAIHAARRRPNEPRAFSKDAADLQLEDLAPAIEALRIRFVMSEAVTGLGPQGEQQYLLALTMLEAAERHAKLAVLERDR